MAARKMADLAAGLKRLSAEARQWEEALGQAKELEAKEREQDF